MKFTRILALAMVVCLLLAGCGAASENAGGAMGSTSADKGYDMMESPSAGVLDSESAASSETALPVNQKLVRKIWIEAETEDMDELLSNVEAKISQLGGYVEARQVQNGSAYANRRYRYADLTVRIPADKLPLFVEDVSQASNITSTRETTDDVTLSYVENESKVLALETEQTRLLELLAKAESMEDILKIESRLTDIRAQLEQVKSQLRLYDNLVSYGTVYLNVTEVKEYTVAEEDPQTLWGRMSAGIADSWKDMVAGLENALVALFVALPHLLPWAVIAGVVVGVILLSRKKKGKKTPPPEKEEK